MKHFMLLAALAGTTLAVANSMGSPSDATLSAVSQGNQAGIDFQGQYVLIIARIPSGIESVEKTYVLIEPKLSLIGDRWFLRGKTVNSGKVLLQHVTDLAVAWDHVTEFSTFTPAAFASFAEQSQAAED